MRSASAGDALAKAAGVGQVAIQARQAGSTRLTGVCWSMNSLTMTPQGSGSTFSGDLRQGRSRAEPANHRITVLVCGGLAGCCTLEWFHARHESSGERCRISLEV